MQRGFSLATTSEVLGVVLSATLFASLAGCGSGQQQPVAETKKFRPADEADSRPVGAETSGAAYSPASGGYSAAGDSAGGGTFQATSGRQSTTISSGGEGTPPGPQMADLK